MVIAEIRNKSVRKKKMRTEEETFVSKKMTFSWFRDIYNAASSFYATIMGDKVADLDTWLETYGKSPIKELQSFVYGIKTDLKAVQNAITLGTSNGIVKGFVNKLKAVKRVMYGRASLHLLKKKRSSAIYPSTKLRKNQFVYRILFLFIKTTQPCRSLLFIYTIPDYH